MHPRMTSVNKDGLILFKKTFGLYQTWPTAAPSDEYCKLTAKLFYRKFVGITS